MILQVKLSAKKTCLWLKGLKPLKPTRKIPLPKEERTQGIWKAHFGDKKLAWNDPETARLRSQTPYGVADAMANQWSAYLCKIRLLNSPLRRKKLK